MKKDTSFESSHLCSGVHELLIEASKRELKSGNFYKSLVAEFLGCLLLVVAGCGTCIGKDWESYNPTVLQISLCFGLSVSTSIWIFGHVSGSHINPAVTMANLVAKKITLVRALFYMIFQCLGATTGAGFLAILTPRDIQGTLGFPSVNPSITTLEALGVESFITFILVMTIFASNDSKRNDLSGNRALPVGLSITLCSIFAIKYTGSCMNPARTLGPGIFSQTWTCDYWIYWVGPFIGATLASLLYEFIFSGNELEKKNKNEESLNSIEENKKKFQDSSLEKVYHLTDSNNLIPY